MACSLTVLKTGTELVKGQAGFTQRRNTTGTTTRPHPPSIPGFNSAAWAAGLSVCSRPDCSGEEGSQGVPPQECVEVTVMVAPDAHVFLSPFLSARSELCETWASIRGFGIAQH